MMQRNGVSIKEVWIRFEGTVSNLLRFCYKTRCSTFWNRNV